MFCAVQAMLMDKEGFCMQHPSLWQQTVQLPEYAPLKGDLETEAAVIGGGMTGLLTAYALRQRGVDAVVLEADRIASGQTARTTAKITSQHGLLYRRLTDSFGHDTAAQYARAQEESIAEYARIIEENNIRCGFQRCNAWLYSREESTVLRQEAEAASALGIDAFFSGETELPFPVAGAVCFRNQARFHPMLFLRGISDHLTIFEKTRVLSVHGREIRTSRGRVTARHIVFASHFPFINVPGLYFMRMHQERSYVLALKSPWLPEDMYLGIGSDSLSLREAGGMLLLGGGGHRTGENRQGSRYDMLRDAAQSLFPGSTETDRWSAQDCITLDGLPYIGHYAPSEPEWYVATGFGKWGMTNAMTAARLIAGMICGAPPDWAEVFSPGRFRLSASARALANETGHALRGLTRELISPPRSLAEHLTPGHGGIVEWEGRKLGVYKDEHGKCTVVDARCPHLGCQVEWNPDERTWDCPCHGSRFTAEGKLIDSPAQEGLGRPKREETE